MKDNDILDLEPLQAKQARLQSFVATYQEIYGKFPSKAKAELNEVTHAILGKGAA